MKTDMHGIYEKYVGYLRTIQSDFRQPVRRMERPDFSEFTVSFIDFCDIWQRWGHLGIQDAWMQALETTVARQTPRTVVPIPALTEPLSSGFAAPARRVA